jgi:hypothetical protein
MPKSNFNQLIDECEGFTATETYNKTNNKIIFENKQPEPEPKPVSNSLEIECETKKQNYQNASAHSHSNVSSSNIFLSKNVNNHQTRFSTKHQFINGTNNGTVANANPFSKCNNNNNCNRNGNNVNINMFKKVGDANDVAFPASSSSSISSSIEINNETFPSLAPPRILTKKVGDSIHDSASGAIPKKFKNFKDAIIASAPEPAVPSPTKQKQIKALQELQSCKTKSHLPPPLLIKRESEILAKTKKISGFYDNDDDDDEYENDTPPGYTSYNYKHQLAKKQYNNDDSDD